MKKKELLERWDIDNSADLYGIRNWGKGYFDIDPRGDVVITPFEDKSIAVSIRDIIEGVRERGMEPPILLRLENLLDAQINELNINFQSAIEESGYRGNYRGVFPIKVNQQEQVIEEISHFGSRYHHGLEAGSKAELIVALSMIKDHESFIICNGYKDIEFIDLGLMAIKMGIKCFFVIEMPNELSLVMDRAQELEIEPLIGVRLKLSAKAGGHWSDSGGDRSIFGLNTTQLIQVIDTLREHDMLHNFKLMHYHLGSQIPNIRDIRSAVLEASRIYVELVKEGAPMGYLDLGGGLAVDYDGSKTNYINSMNYTLTEYCHDIVEVVMSTCEDNEVPHPTIITESGRATVAYYSVLIINSLDNTRFEAQDIPDNLPALEIEQIMNLYDVYNSITLKNIQECFNDALYYRDVIHQQFKHGDLSLREKSVAEKIFWNIINRIAIEKDRLRHIPPELEGIDAAISDIYYCNFSVFQSLPDSWAIGQIFPTMPVHMLDRYPARNAVIADITCDCDGKLDRFISNSEIREYLQLHDFADNQDYYIGIFLVGAYQETLGDLHNLMGDPNVVSVRIGEQGHYDIVREIEGDSVADVLSYVEYDPKRLLEQFRSKAEQAVRGGLITVAERRKIVKSFESGLSGYTYFEK